MKLVAVDIETTGLDPNRHGIVEFGAVYFDLERSFEPKTIHLQVYPENMVWSAYCLALHRELLNEIINRWGADDKFAPGKPRILESPVLIGLHFRDWLIAVCGQKDEQGNYRRTTGAGKNFGSFDLQFLLKSGGCEGIFRHRSLDPTTLYIDPIEDVPPELKLCKERAGLVPRVAHRALADAWDVVDLLQIKFRKQI